MAGVVAEVAGRDDVVSRVLSAVLPSLQMLSGTLKTPSFPNRNAAFLGESAHVAIAHWHVAVVAEAFLIAEGARAE